MADIIQLLPDHVANQIAAGEVVQRPASVVKELLENSIDSGATSIKLIVKDGGKTLIQVVDNGSGMSTTDARLSFERHATSKISQAEDLFRIQTKGFRGEALASIAAIAHIEMHTRLKEEELGTEIRIEGSKVISQEFAAVATGTSIAVKNLFYNIPARRNFLKSNQVELRHITDEFQRVALAHPGVEFVYYSNGSPLFKLSKSETRKRIVQVFGRKTNEKLVPVEEETPQIRISGYICKPEFAKKSRGEQFFFVNNRFIKSSYLHHAMISAFEGLIRSDHIPGYFLFMEVDPASIDINIHPTKTEIKFEDEHTLYAILRSAVKHSLGQFNVAPAIDFDSDPNLQTPYHFRNRTPNKPEISFDSSFNPFQAKAGQLGRVSGGGHKNLGWEEHYVGLESGLGDTEEMSRMNFEEEPGETGELFDISAGSMVTTLQLGRKYILVTIKSGLLVIDQHRAHQRVLYEQLLKSLTLRETVSQQLLFPLVFSYNKSEIKMLHEMEECLGTLGFSFEQWEADQVEIKGIPPFVKEDEVGIVLDSLLADYLLKTGPEMVSQADMLAKSLCKTMAVRSGETMEPTSQLALVNDLFACKEIDRSPFNKPIFITIKEKDIEHKFI
ncbi:MAG: DNA mismatch repair endonuclease MutL [Flavobacteriaceae bacterium]